MRSVLINDGKNMQVDLVPENDIDKAVLATFEEGQMLRVGKAYGYAPCRGGYMRSFGPRSDTLSFVFLTTVSKPE